MPTGSGGRIRNAKDINRLIASRITTGKVILQDDFEVPLVKWWAYGSGTIARHTTHAFDGDASLGLTTGAGDYAQQEAAREFGMPQNKRIGFEFYWAAPVTNMENMDFGIEYRHRDANIRDRGRIRIYPLAGVRPRYIDQAGGQTTFGAGTGLPTHYDVGNAYSFWHHCKLVVDFIKREYVYFLINDVLVDMTGIRLEADPILSEYNMLEVFAEFTKGAGVTAAITGLIDNVVVTNEEP